MKSILVTGFKPFLGQSLNPSELLLQKIASANLNMSVQTLLLPVSYSQCFEEFIKFSEQARFDLVIALGQARSRRHLSLEKVAVNLIDALEPDEDGQCHLNAHIELDGPAAIINPLDLHAIKHRVLASDVEISYSAGAYVCNYFYYKLLAWSQQRGKQALFVHVPSLPEQSPEGMPLARQFELLKQLIHSI